MSTRYQVSGPNGQTRPSLRTLELGSIQPRPRFPISPPETERNATVHTSSPEHKVPMVSTPDGEKEREESPFRHLRRAPSVQYNQATMNLRPAQPRAPRWLLVVLPPASCLEGDPALGQALAMGPPGRLQSGVLIPLLPTMYAQLAAIAKEFNFPSTAGVCLYLHVSEPGVNVSPRISDDTWPMLWSQYFNSEDNASPTPSGLPICGQIEFDVDVRKAKWYEYWATGQERRVSLDASIPPSVAQTMSRWYQEHREATQEAPDSLLNDNTTTSTAHLRSKPVPRPLTLPTRGDGFNRSLAKYKLVNPRDVDAVESVGSKRAPSRLSPVLQVDESASVNQKDLDTLVREWRATTPMAPAIPRPGPAGESIPDTYDDLPATELDMDDYQWSISSAGPPSRWPTSAELDPRLQSVGLDRRMLGSVILTPSVATPFGPGHSPATPTFSNASRFPSPDIAARMIEDSPATPSTATSWGAPLSWPATPASVTRIPSPDMAARAFISVPNTPTTATSWGAPSLWPASPASVYRPESPDIGLRAFGSTPPTPSTATSWGAPEFWPPSPLEESRPSTPDIAARVHDDEIEEAQTYPFVWPFFDRNATPPYQFVWPFLNKEVTPTLSATGIRPHPPQLQTHPSPSSRSEVSPFTLVWPYFTGSSQMALLKDLRLSVDYPSMIIYEAIYPSLVIYPPYGTDSAENGSLQKLMEKICPAYDYPNLVIYANTVAPSANEEILASDCKNNYGFFDLYTTVYPFVVPYPARYECRLDTAKAPRLPASARALPQATNLSPSYPFLDLYPAPYPSLVIYPLATPIPQTEQNSPSKVVPSMLVTSSYPHLALYKSTYPHLEIYPSITVQLQESEHKVDRLVRKGLTPSPKAELCSTRLLSHYPFFNLYPASYPVLEIYPEYHAAPSTQSLTLGPKLKDLRLSSHCPHLDIYPTLSSAKRSLQIQVLTPPEEEKPCNTGLSSFYPYLNIYPSTYPFLEIYPPNPQTEQKSPSKLVPSMHLTSSYPHLVLYKSTYPDLEIYPSVTAHLQESEHKVDRLVRKALTSSKAELCSTRPLSHYPFFNLYPASYPVLEIYPEYHAAPSTQTLTPGPKLRDLKLSSHYPHLDIYPAVYPYLEIYPTLSSPKRPLQIQLSRPAEEEKPCNTGLSSFYPYLNIYPSTYPFLEIYSPSPLTTIEHPIVPPSHYPNIVIYEPIRASHTPTPERSHGLPIRLVPTYPAFDLYPAAYPNLEIYPHIANQKLVIEPVLLPGALCHYPTLCIYPVTQQPHDHRKTPSLSISVRLSDSIRSSAGSPRQRTRRGSNQWTLSGGSSAIPRLWRGSVHAPDSCDTRLPAASSARKPITRPHLKPRKSHSDLIREVLAQVALSERSAQEESKGSAPGVSTLWRVSSARVGESPHSDLDRSRTIPTSIPPVLRFHASSRSSGGHSESLKSIGSSADAIAAVMSGMARDGGIADRISRLDSHTTPDTSSIKLSRRVSKLDKSRYSFL